MNAKGCKKAGRKGERAKVRQREEDRKAESEGGGK